MPKNNLDADRARSFFAGWHSLTDASQPDEQVIRWVAFFAAWTNLPADAKQPTRKIIPVLDAEAFQTFANDFPTRYSLYRSSGVMTNVWKTAGIGTDEMRNSKVLAWMLNCFGDHGKGTVVLTKLIVKAIKIHPDLGITLEHVTMLPYRTKIESLPLGEQESRVDIEIESPAFLLFIEVKIKAPESGNQLERYVEVCRKKAGERPWAVLFLTLNGREPESENLRGIVKPLSWRQIADVLDDLHSTQPTTNLTDHLFRQYADHIRQLSRF